MDRSLPLARLLLTVRVLVLALLLLAVFWTLAFLLVLLTAWLKGLPLTAAGLIPQGVVCGLITALFVAVFHIKREVIRLPVPNRNAFDEQVRAHLEELGYVCQGETPDRRLFKPTFRSLLFGATVQVEVTGAWARLTGPRVYLEVIRRRLRVESYLNRTERDGRLLRRVELTLRITPEQLHRVRSDLIKALRDADAKVVCQLSVLAHSDAGIRDAVVEEALQGWRQAPGSSVEIHKEPLSGPQFQEHRRSRLVLTRAS
jgi:hypothetical protein